MNNDNDNFIEKALARGRDVHLSVSEKEQVRKALLNTMEGKIQPMAPSRERRSYVFTSMWMVRMPVTIAIVLALSAGTSFAAHQTIPGDILYPVKIGVNEKVEILLAVSSKRVASVTSRHALTRLAEAEQLASEGKLDEVTKAVVETAFTQNVANLKENLKKIEGDGEYNVAADINAAFEEGLGNHLGAFVQLSLRVGTDTPEVDAIANSVGAEFQSTHNDRVALGIRQAEGIVASSSQVAAEIARVRAEERISAVEKFIAGITPTSSVSSAGEQMAQRLSRAHDELAKGVLFLESALYGDAFYHFKRSETFAQDAKLLAILDAKVKKGLTVRSGATPVATASLRAVNAKGMSEDTIEENDDEGDDDETSLSATSRMMSEEEDDTGDENESHDNLEIEIEHSSSEKSEKKPGIRVNIRF